MNDFNLIDKTNAADDDDDDIFSELDISFLFDNDAAVADDVEMVTAPLDNYKELKMELGKAQEENKALGFVVEQLWGNIDPQRHEEIIKNCGRHYLKNTDLFSYISIYKAEYLIEYNQKKHMEIFNAKYNDVMRKSLLIYHFIFFKNIDHYGFLAFYSSYFEVFILDRININEYKIELKSKNDGPDMLFNGIHIINDLFYERFKKGQYYEGKIHINTKKSELLKLMCMRPQHIQIDAIRF